MKHLNIFYKLAEDISDNDFDLKVLPEDIYIDPPIIITTSKRCGERPSIKEFGGGYKKSTKADYDASFCQKIYSLRPQYILTEFLEYHYEYYKSIEDDHKKFLNHIEYEILKHIGNNQLKDIIKKWLIKHINMIIEKQLREKNLFLLTAYEAACEFAPESPLSVSLIPIEVGNTIGLSEASSKRIVGELVQEGFATSGLGYRMLLITHLGLQYLQETNITKDTPPAVTVNAGNQTNVQIQSNTVNSSQTQNITLNNNDLSQFINDIKASIDELKNHLSNGDIEDLTTDIAELEKGIEQNKPNRVKRFLSGVWDTLKTVPKEVLVKALTNPEYINELERLF